MSIESLAVFDSWLSSASDSVFKARKAKGLENWSRLQHMAEKLAGKKSSDISFTCAHPTHVGATHVLGSVVGNLHFLLGFGNPGFHLAQYHFQVMEPNLEDAAAEELYHLKGHPSRPEIWKQAGLDEFPEGDLELGMPHPAAVAAKKKAKRENEGIRVTVGAGIYLAVPSEGLVYGEHNGHVYTWDVVKDSFMTAMNPSLVTAMEAAVEEEKSEKAISSFGPEIPEAIKYHVPPMQSFDPAVYPLIKSTFPKPGSVIPINTPTRETLYGVVTDKEISFFDREGARVTIRVYDRIYKSFDLGHGGDIHPSVLYNFGVSYVGLLTNEDLCGISSQQNAKEAPLTVKGDPSPGFDAVGAEQDNLESLCKSVVFTGMTYRLVVKDLNE